MAQRNTAYERMGTEAGNGSGAQALHVRQQLQQPVNRNKLTPRDRHKSVLLGLALAETFIGSLSVLLGIVTLIIAGTNQGRAYYDSYLGSSYYDWYLHNLTWSSQGIWCGAFAIVIGILGIKAKSNPSVGMYKANMAMSIIGANMMGVLMIMSCNAAPATNLIGLIVMHSLLAVLGLTGVIVCIVHSAYCCVGICCRNKPHHGAVMYVAQPNPQQLHQVVQLANGQYMMVPAQAMAAQHPVAPVPMIGAQYRAPSGMHGLKV